MEQPDDDEHDSLATWDVTDNDVVLRVPWLQLGIVAPSAHRALVPVVGEGVPVATTVAATTVGLRVVPSRGAEAAATLAWDEWNVVQATERLKTGHEAYVEALRDVLVPPSEP